MLAASLASCGGSQRTTGVAAVLSSDTSSQLSPQLRSFLEVLPADVAGFGYLEFGKPIDQLVDFGPHYQAMIGDLLEMAQRRWGIDLHQTQGLGLAMIKDQGVLFAQLGDAVSLTSNDADLAVAKLGSFTVMSKPDVVAALLAAAKQGTLIATQPEWVRSAMGHAAGSPVFLTLASERMPAEQGADATAVAVQKALRYLTVVAGADGGAAYLLARPGEVATVQQPLEQGLALARAALQAKLSETSGGDPGRMLQQLLLNHYGNSLLGGLKVQTNGDELSLSMPWRAPVLPAVVPAPALSERVVVPDEWAVAQLDAGRPLVATMVAMTDLFGATIDQPKLTSEMLAAMSQALGVPSVDPHTATVSVGGMSALVSLHAANASVARAPTTMAQGELLGAGTPWGLVVTVPRMESTLAAALAKPAAALPLAASSRFAGRTELVFRAMVDLERVPTMVKMVTGNVPVRSIEIGASSTSFEADVVARPGQVQVLQQYVELAKGFLASKLGTGYAGRKQATAEQEAMAIVEHHQLMLANQVLTPKVDGDRLTFAYAMPPIAAKSMAIASGVGVVAGLTVPLFLRYRAASAPQPMQQAM